LSVPTEKFIASIGAIARGRFDCPTYPQQNLPADDWALLARAGVTLPAVEFLKADIAGVRGEFGLLGTGVLDG
jgi:hypothetical protein